MSLTTGDSSHSSIAILLLLTHCSFRNLSTWAENGVLMLNTCLTVRQGNSNSHADKGWEKFTDYVIQMVDEYGGANLSSPDASGGTGFGRGVVFLAWGAHAAKRIAGLDKVIFFFSFLFRLPSRNNFFFYFFSEQTPDPQERGKYISSTIAAIVDERIRSTRHRILQTKGFLEMIISS